VEPLGAWRGKKQKVTFSRKKRFRLSASSNLPRSSAPDVRGRAFTITAQIKPRSAGGVIVAQGGSTDGYALYLEEGKPVFATRHKGRLTLVKASESLPAGETTLAVSLTKQGVVSISAGDRNLATGKTPGPLAAMPIDGLQVGRDLDGAVGEYTAPHEFGGKIEEVLVKLEE
jgi:arylsulfatase